MEHSDADDDAVPARRSASAACAKPAGAGIFEVAMLLLCVNCAHVLDCWREADEPPRNAGRPSATASAVRAADAGGAGSAPTDQSEAEAQLQQALALSLGQAAGRAAAAAAPPPAGVPGRNS